MLRPMLLTLGLLVTITPSFAGGAAAAELTAAGVWEQIDPDTGTVGAYITIDKHHGVYEGTMTKLFPKPDDDPNPVCADCKGDQKGHPYLGLRLIDNMVRHGLTYDGGTITDPRNGTQYHLELTLSPDGQTLTVRGYVGVSLFGSSQDWKRLPPTADAPTPTPAAQ